MTGIFSAEKIGKNEHGDLTLLILMFLLISFGVINLFSASFFFSEKLFSSMGRLMIIQVIALGIGAAGGFLLSRLSMTRIMSLVTPLLAVSFILMLLTLVPGVGTAVLGARRWINIFGFSFQPSELAKLSVILYLAKMIEKKAERMNDFFNAVLPQLIVIAVMVALVYMQNDYSTAMFILLVAVVMFFLAGLNIWYFIGIALIILPVGLILLLSKEHRVDRLINFLDPASDPLGRGYQVIASRESLIRGGFWGSGFGKGIGKLGGLPEAYSDFIFAILGEETGFIGVICILCLFSGFAVRGYMIAMGARNTFGSFAAFGITSSIFLQALLNMAVVSGLVPATGIPLPFFSHGGSSLIVTLFMCGVVVAVSRSDSGDRRSAS